jgi:hypothetical protein
MANKISHIKAIYNLYNKTDMDFLAVEYDVICTEKINNSTAKKSIFV